MRDSINSQSPERVEQLPHALGLTIQRAAITKGFMEVLQVDDYTRRKPTNPAAPALDDMPIEGSNVLCGKTLRYLRMALQALLQDDMETVEACHDGAIGHQIICRRVLFGRVDYDTAIEQVYLEAKRMGVSFPVEETDAFFLRTGGTWPGKQRTRGGNH